jgi:hypothetical protein
LAAHAEPPESWCDTSATEYIQHLQNFDRIVTVCQSARAAQPQAASFAACDPAQVGPNDRVAWPAGTNAAPREIRYDWLRQTLARAAKKESTADADSRSILTRTKKRALNINDLLAEARQRLAFDTQQAASPATINPGYGQERKKLNAILTDSAYRHTADISPRERLLEWLDGLLHRIFAGAARIGEHMPWLVWALCLLLLAAILTALIWFLIRQQRNARVRLTPDLAPAPDAPSAREWQLWLQDAQTMAAQDRWREAVHFVYWAAIAKLESLRLWPADRARTPREYLHLLAAGDARQSSLTALTHSFEHIWYGGRAAASADYQAALELAASLGVKTP